MAEKHTVDSSNAALIKSWFKDRGGIAIWRCADLSNLAQTWTTPLTTADGGPPVKPHWSSEDKPERIITNIEECEVGIDEEVKRFHVALHNKGWGKVVVSDTGSRRIEREIEKAGKGAYHTFDYGTRECIIHRQLAAVSLAEYGGSAPCLS